MRFRYLFWRWLAPKLPTRRLRDWAWAHKWALWHALYGPHERLWAEPMGTAINFTTEHIRRAA
jgi:hypothetical protein